jgi:hypothetical protein
LPPAYRVPPGGNISITRERRFKLALMATTGAEPEGCVSR